MSVIIEQYLENITVSVGEITDDITVKVTTEKGKNAFEVWLETNAVGTLEQYNAFIKGEAGYNPVKGTDYFDGADGYTPVKGVDYFDGEKGDKGNATGLNSYATKASLPTTGTLTTSYKVTSDPVVSNNGYYRWNGSAYVKDYDLVNGVIESGNLEAVSGGAVVDYVYDKKGLLKSDAAALSSASWIKDAIISLEITEWDGSETFYLQCLGNNFLGRKYLGIESSAGYVLSSEDIVNGSITNYGFVTISSVLTGISEYYLYNLNGINYGKIKIDWSKVPNGTRYATTAKTSSFQQNILSVLNRYDELTDELINELKYDFLSSSIELGGFTAAGTLVESNARIRTKDLIPVEIGNYKLNITSNFGLVSNNGLSYDSGGGNISFIVITADGNLSVIEGVSHLRLGFKKADNSLITQTEIEDLKISLIGLDTTGYDTFQKEFRAFKKIQSIVPEPVITEGSFKNKKLAVLGDSISYGFIPRNYTGYPGLLNSYAKLTTEKLEMTFQNNGISGSTIGALSIGSTTNSPFVYRYSDLDDSADIILVMGGTNDIRKGIQLGAFADSDETTFYGALHFLCLGLLEKYRHNQGTTIGQNKHIILATPIKLLNPDISNYAKAVVEVAKYYSMPVWDAYNLSGINPHILRTLQGTETGYTDVYNPYITDGTHPTQEGHEIMSKALIGFLNTIQ